MSTYFTINSSINLNLLYVSKLGTKLPHTSKSRTLISRLQGHISKRYIHFLLLLSQIGTKLVAYNKFIILKFLD